jgi:hypothetical protein
MKAQLAKRSYVVRHRTNLQRLVDRIERKPFDYLTERSVECLDRFFSGYQIFGPPLWRDLTSFEFWLKERLIYPEDSASRWWRFIQLNSKDRFGSFELFCRLYRHYRKHKPVDVQPSAPEITLRSDSFDFYKHLYAISKRPAMYLGSDDVQSLAAYLAGYFTGKKHAALGLTRDEKEFYRFAEWLRRHYNFRQEYPWYRLVEMWPRARNSLESFFVEYDAFLTNFGKKVRGFEDLFETVRNVGSTYYRRREKLPNDLIRVPDSPMWWRSPASR